VLEIPDQRSDAELLAAHVAGDPYAFEELFLRYHWQLIRVARQRSRSLEDAADAVQEAMLSAHRGAPVFQQHCTVSTWLHRIVVNKCVDQLRRQPHRYAALPHCHPPARDLTPAVDTGLVVHRALAALPAEQRAAVLTVDIQGHSIAQAALLLDIALGTVKSRRARGRARLAVLLAELEPPSRQVA
jgi:RNA polymerase sigma-70 factor (ECF subfamily)